MSTPAERIRRFMTDAFYRSDTTANDALAALAELERERDRHAEVREIITSVVCGALNRAGINEVDNPGVAIDAIRNRAENAERERDELRVALSIFYHAHESGNSVPPHICADAEKLIARPTRKDGE